VKYPTPQGPGLADRAKQDLKQAAQQGKRWYKRYGGEQYQLYWTYGIVAAIGLLVGVYWLGQKFRMEFLGGKEELAKARATAVLEWKKGSTGGAVPFDVNADGQLDVVGVFKGLDPAGDYLGAFDGKTGKQLWRQAAPKLNFTERLVLVGDKLTLAVGKQLQLIDAKSGELLRTGELPHVAREVCPGPDASAFVIRNYRQYSKIDTATLAATADDGGWCAKRSLVGSGTELDQVPALPSAGAAGGHGAAASRLVGGAALQSGEVTLVTGKLDGRLVVLGLDPQGKELWRRELTTPAQNASVTRAEAAGVLYVVEPYAKPPTLHAIDVKTGKDKWATSKLLRLGLAFTITASADAVYVTTDGMLHVVDAKTGAARFTLGEQPGPD